MCWNQEVVQNGISGPFTHLNVYYDNPKKNQTSYCYGVFALRITITPDLKRMHQKKRVINDQSLIPYGPLL